MLDNIVTDGMRVAREVGRRMEEAQRELEKGGEYRDDDDDHDDARSIYAKSVHDGDRDLLEGAEAAVGGAEEGKGTASDKDLL